MAQQQEEPRSPWTATEPGETTQPVAGQQHKPFANEPDYAGHADPADVIAAARVGEQRSFQEGAERLTGEPRPDFPVSQPVYVGGLAGMPNPDAPTEEISIEGAGTGADDDAGEHCSHCGGRIPNDHELLTEVLNWLAPAGETFVSEFYASLFEAAPDLRPLFPADIKIQEEKLLSAIVALLQLFKAGEEQMEQLNSALARFGRAHTRFAPAATIEEYATVWTVLSEVAGEMLAGKITERHVAALRRAYEYAAGLMLAAQATARLKGTGRRRREV